MRTRPMKMMTNRRSFEHESNLNENRMFILDSMDRAHNYIMSYIIHQNQQN